MGACTSGCCAKMPGYYAALGLHIAIAFSFAGLLASSTDMFAFVQIPTCAEGTTSKFSERSKTKPYCSSEALFSNVIIPLDTIGYIGITRWSFHSNKGVAAGRTVDLCVRGSCDALQTDGAKVRVQSVSTVAGAPSVLKVSPADLSNLTLKLTGMADSFISSDFKTALDFTNLPVQFATNPAAPGGSSLPSGLTAGTVYYLRPMPPSSGGGYAVATSTSGLPLSNIADVALPSTFTFYSADLHATCPNQISKINEAVPGPDGAISNRVCGYCLNQTQRVGVLAVPGTTGAAIALMLILAILMMIPAARKGAWFRCFTFFIAVFSIVFLIAAVSAGYVMMASVLGCNYGAAPITTNFNLQNQFQPIAYNAAGSAWGGSIPQTQGGTFTCNGAADDRPACYNMPVALLPSYGASYLIVALLVLFVWACVVGCRIDFKLDDAVPAAAPKL